MKKILGISGSASQDSSNTRLLQAIASSFSESFDFRVYDGLSTLPLFTPELQGLGVPEEVKNLKAQVQWADAVIISTPEYLHNVHAVLKNALEWMTESGELAHKPVLPITFTPAAPRGEYAMISLLQSLKASKAKVVAELSLYRNELTSNSDQIEFITADMDLLREAMRLLSC